MFEVCLVYGGEIKEWHVGIMECEECNSMFDSEILDDIEDGFDMLT